MNHRNNIIEHNGILYEFGYFNDCTHHVGGCGWLERQFPDEKERNEIKGRMIEQLVKSGRMSRVEPKKIELVKDGLFYMEDV